jgi:hypothetical protein
MCLFDSSEGALLNGKSIPKESLTHKKEEDENIIMKMMKHHSSLRFTKSECDPWMKNVNL